MTKLNFLLVLLLCNLNVVIQNKCWFLVAGFLLFLMNWNKTFDLGERLSSMSVWKGHRKMDEVSVKDLHLQYLHSSLTNHPIRKWHLSWSITTVAPSRYFLLHIWKKYIIYVSKMVWIRIFNNEPIKHRKGTINRADGIWWVSDPGLNPLAETFKGALSEKAQPVFFSLSWVLGRASSCLGNDHGSWGSSRSVINLEGEP